MEPRAAEIFEYWFGQLDEHGRCSPERQQGWWEAGPEVDAEIRRRFLGDHRAIAAGEREAWRAGPVSLVAYVIVLDQFSRNIFRDTPAMYAEDARARRAVHTALDAGLDRQLAIHPRSFLYMPLMHSETVADHDIADGLFRQLRDDATGPAKDDMEKVVGYQDRHAAIVRRFGRYPHRNAILGRESTPEEVEFLKQPGSSF